MPAHTNPPGTPRWHDGSERLQGRSFHGVGDEPRSWQPREKPVPEKPQVYNRSNPPPPLSKR